MGINLQRSGKQTYSDKPDLSASTAMSWFSYSIVYGDSKKMSASRPIILRPQNVNKTRFVCFYYILIVERAMPRLIMRLKDLKVRFSMFIQNVAWLMSGLVLIWWSLVSHNGAAWTGITRRHAGQTRGQCHPDVVIVSEAHSIEI